MCPSNSGALVTVGQDSSHEGSSHMTGCAVDLWPLDQLLAHARSTGLTYNPYCSLWGVVFQGRFAGGGQSERGIMNGAVWRQALTGSIKVHGGIMGWRRGQLWGGRTLWWGTGELRRPIGGLECAVVASAVNSASS